MLAEIESESNAKHNNKIDELRKTYSKFTTDSNSSDNVRNLRNFANLEITGSSDSDVESNNNINTPATLNASINQISSHHCRQTNKALEIKCFHTIGCDTWHQVKLHSRTGKIRKNRSSKYKNKWNMEDQ